MRSTISLCRRADRDVSDTTILPGDHHSNATTGIGSQRLISLVARVAARIQARRRCWRRMKPAIGLDLSGLALRALKCFGVAFRSQALLASPKERAHPQLVPFESGNPKISSRMSRAGSLFRLAQNSGNKIFRENKNPEAWKQPLGC